MARAPTRIHFDAEEAAETMLERVLKRHRYPSELRNRIADYLEEIVTVECAKAGCPVVNIKERHHA